MIHRNRNSSIGLLQQEKSREPAENAVSSKTGAYIVNAGIGVDIVLRAAVQPAPPSLQEN